MDQEHEHQHEGIAKEFDHIAEILNQKEEVDSELLKRIEALEKRVTALESYHAQ